MTNRRQPWMHLVWTPLVGVAVGLLLTGCGGDEPPPPPPVVQGPVAPPPPPAPKVASVESLMAELSIDSRVMLPEEQAPSSTAKRRVILEFFDAFARGDATVLGSMLSATDKVELDAMVESGTWKKATTGIEAIDLQAGLTRSGDDCVLAVIEVDFEFQPQLWYYSIDGDEVEFVAEPMPPDIMDRLTGNWIEAWYEILDDELALANTPDETLEPLRQNLDTGAPDEEQPGGGSPASSPGRGPGMSPNSPGAPSGPGRRERPTRKPPGRGG